jgi:hypothetical protein
MPLRVASTTAFGVTPHIRFSGSKVRRFGIVASILRVEHIGAAHIREDMVTAAGFQTDALHTGQIFGVSGGRGNP